MRQDFSRLLHHCSSQGYHRAIDVITYVKTGCNGDRQVMSPVQTVRETLRGKQELARQRRAEGRFRKRENYMKKNNKLCFMGER